MDFQTKVELPSSLPPITHAGRILLMGSCFAENIGSLLAESKFRIDVNPYGILYNPLSISTALGELIENKVYEEEDLFFYKGLWHSSMHHGSFSATTSRETLENINSRLLFTHKSLKKLDWLILTLGTAYVYELKDSGGVVSNCHKLPENQFIRHLLSVEEVVRKFASLIVRLKSDNPDLKILFTVSPIRHLRDGLHANQISKSILLVAIDRLQQMFPKEVFYFPSYEIVIDELRDYRFYAEDMLHPSPLAIRYLWERLSEVFFSEETKRIVKAVEDIRKDLTHKPFYPQSETYQRFLGQIALKIEKLNCKYPFLDFQKEIELC